MTNTGSPTSDRRHVRASNGAAKHVVRSIVAASLLTATATLTLQPAMAASAGARPAPPAPVTVMASGCSALCSHI